MKKIIKFSSLITASLLMVGCVSLNKENVEPPNEELEVIETKKIKEVKTLFIPIGGFTSGFIYCGFDGDKTILQDMTSEGWEIKNIIPQTFETSKRNGEIVICNGSSYILERES